MLTCRPPVYAAHASASFNQWLHAELTELAGDVRKRLGPNFVALLLGSGYGRGEGGVAWRHGAEALSDPVSLFLVVHTRWGVRYLLTPVQRAWQERLRVAIDFGRPFLPAEAAHLPCRLVFHEWERGHVLLAGSAQVACDRPPERFLILGGVKMEGWDSRSLLPPVEATRLLLDRGAGLLRAWRVRSGLDRHIDPDFVRRSAWQAILAVGDALLLSYEQFDAFYRIRGERLPQLLREHGQLARLGLGPLYKSALGFQFTPDRLSEPDLAQVADLWTAVFLHVESRRCGRVWSSPVEYSQNPHLREPQFSAPWRWPVNLCNNACIGEWTLVHPREWMFRHLPDLLSHRRCMDPQWQRESERLIGLWHRHRAASIR